MGGCRDLDHRHLEVRQVFPPDMKGSMNTPLIDHPRAIRLVKIDGKDEHGYLKLTIRNTILGHELERFVAVSYVWGTQDPTYIIVFNGEYHPVRPNLWSFLMTAHETKFEEEMWIDALCINQFDIREKSRQIPLMGDIFTNARRIIGWLHGHMKTEHEPAGIELAKAMTMDFAVNLDEMALKMQLTLIRLISHEYWSRLWIVQELELHSEAVSIWWHGHEISWTQLKSFATKTFGNPPGRSDGSSSKADQTRTILSNQSLPFFDFCVDDKKAKIVSLRLIDIVLQYANHVCSVGHDRVFGLLAFTPHARDFGVMYEESKLSLMARVMYSSTHLPTLTESQRLGEVLDVHPESIEIAAVRTVRLTGLSRTPDSIDLVLGFIPGAALYILLGLSAELGQMGGGTSRGNELGFLCFVDGIINSDHDNQVSTAPSLNALQEDKSLRFQHRWFSDSVHITASWMSLYDMLLEHHRWVTATKSRCESPAQMSLNALFETLMDRPIGNIHVQIALSWEEFPEVPASAYNRLPAQNKWPIT